MRLVLAVCCGLIMCSLAAPAQTGTTAEVGATPSKAFDSQLDLIEEEMMGAVKAMPAEKYSFAPTAALFVPGQQSLVQAFGSQAGITCAGPPPAIAVRNRDATNLLEAGFKVLTQRDSGERQTVADVLPMVSHPAFRNGLVTEQGSDDEATSGKGPRD